MVLVKDKLLKNLAVFIRFPFFQSLKTLHVHHVAASQVLSDRIHSCDHSRSF